MADPLRRAGTGTFGDRATVVWSVAEGRRGRRWREMRSRDGAMISSLLLETDPDRSFSHLELATAAGLLTLHPEPDGTLHGNAVTSAGVRHIASVPWPPGCLLVVDGSAVSIAALGWALELVPSTPGKTLPVVNVDPTTLAVSATTFPVDGSFRAPIDANGLPDIQGGTTWPLEVSD